MTKSEIDNFHKVLQKRVVELGNSTWRRDAIAIEKSADEQEQMLRAVERELAVRALESETVRMRETQAALRRIEDGTFGICQECEEEISPRWLKVLPWAALCIKCQEENDCHCGEKHERPVLAMAA